MKSKKKLKKIYHVFFEEYGECDVFFNENGKLIAYWHGNDASWRGEYFSGLLAYMGWEVESVDKDEETEKTFKAVLRKNDELWDDEDEEQE